MSRSSSTRTTLGGRTAAIRNCCLHTRHDTKKIVFVHVCFFQTCLIIKTASEHLAAHAQHCGMRPFHGGACLPAACRGPNCDLFIGYAPTTARATRDACPNLEGAERRGTAASLSRNCRAKPRCRRVGAVWNAEYMRKQASMAKRLGHAAALATAVSGCRLATFGTNTNTPNGRLMQAVLYEQ